MSNPFGNGSNTGTGGPIMSQQEYGTQQDRFESTRAQVDEVVVIMRDNVEKVLHREERLQDLDTRADALQAGASQFERQAGAIRRKYWWQNIKMMIILGVIGVVLILIIALSIAYG